VAGQIEQDVAAAVAQQHLRPATRDLKHVRYGRGGARLLLVGARNVAADEQPQQVLLRGVAAPVACAAATRKVQASKQVQVLL
jgi:hypothetical protein